MNVLNHLIRAVIGFLCSIFSCLVFAGDPGGIYGDWTIQQINDRLVPDNIDSSLTFSEDDRMGAKAGCNMLIAGFSLNNNKIDIGQAAATRKICPEDVMVYESLLFKALESADGISLKDQTLTLVDEEGNSVLQAIRQ